MNASTGRYPRVLVLAQNKIQPFTGGGILLTALFEGFPPENLLFFHRDTQYDLPSVYEEHRIRIGWLRLDIRAALSNLRRFLSASVKEPGNASLTNLVALLKASCWFELPPRLDGRVRAFRPDVIYAWAADALWSRTLEKLAARWRLPYVIHFMDNHYEVTGRTLHEKALAAAYQEQLTKVAVHASTLYTISDGMGRAYSRTWNQPYEVYRAAGNLAEWPHPSRPARAADGVFRIAFTGSTDRSQIAGLANVARAMDLVAARGHAVRLVLYLTEQYERAARPVLAPFPSVEFRRHPDASELRDELLRMDAMVLAYGFDEESVTYYRYSFATKSVTYMLAGRPILAHGPASIEPIAYASRTGAIVVDEPGDERLASVIERLIVDDCGRARLAEAAWEEGCREHDRATQAERFVGSLLRIARLGAQS